MYFLFLSLLFLLVCFRFLPSYLLLPLLLLLPLFLWALRAPSLRAVLRAHPSRGTSTIKFYLSHFGKVICATCRSLFSSRGLQAHERKCKGSHLRAPPPRLSSAQNAPDDRSLPDLDDIFLNITPVLHVIPARDVVQVGRIVQSELYTLQSNPASTDALARLFMVLKCVIPGSTRAGKHHSKSQISTKCNLWASGRIMELWDHAVATSDHLKARASSKQPKAQGQQSSSARSAAATRLAGEGCLGKAIAALSSDGIAPMTRATFQKLESKHPDAPRPEAPADAPDAAAAALPGDFDLVAALRSFPHNTSAGPSGLRAHHLLQFCNAPLQFSFATTLRNFVNSMLSGSHFPPSVATSRVEASRRCSSLARESTSPTTRPRGMCGRSALGKHCAASFPSAFAPSPRSERPSTSVPRNWE